MLNVYIRRFGMRELENKLAELYKGAPDLPKKAKDAIVEYWPYVVLVLGVLQLLAALALWRLADATERLADFGNALSAYYGGQAVSISAFDKTMIYAGVGLLVVEAVIMLMAVSPLLKRQRKGWELLFLVSLLQVVYAVVLIFVDGRGVGGFIGSLIGAAIGFYFLFQIRDYYKGKTVAKTQ
jgi:hypothetical protein